MARDMLARYAGETVLAVGAHPDDVEIGVGGTVARLARLGARVVLAVMSVPNQLERRLEESRLGAQALGAELRMLRPERESRVEDMKSYELVERLDALVKELAPAAMFSHGLSDFHKDHLLVFEACRSALRLRSMDFFCYYPSACRPIPVSFLPQAFVDISEDIEAKMRSLAAHHSQFGGRGLRTEFYKSIAEDYGRKLEVRYAEGLEVVRMRLG